MSEQGRPVDGQEADEGQAALEALLSWLEARYPSFLGPSISGRWV
ncbi:hypothetical protein AB0K60_32745 [Thermopolyspora sp. NPDC052614]